jgi:hypothetical protein
LRRQFFEESYQLAWDHLRRETGLLYVHQSQAAFPLPAVSCTDRTGNSFSLDLGQTAFVLQKKGVCLADALPQIFAKEGIQGIEKIIDSWFSFIHQRMQQNIIDRDSETVLNFGLENGVLFHLDPGRLCLLSSREAQSEWRRVGTGFRQWLQEHYPAACPHFDEQFAIFSHQ